MTTLYAQPYDITATGFYFETKDEYEAKANETRNNAGQSVGEFEIQFIDGEDIDAALVQAWNVSQVSISGFLDATDLWTEDEKTRFIIAVGECGYDQKQAMEPEQIDITIYEVGSMRELAEQFVDEGLFGDIPEHLTSYIDYEAIARVTCPPESPSFDR